MEVRSRSLRSIVFKLGNGFISYSDLVNEKEFLVHLLEWFNHDEWVLESQVLTLIQQLAQVSATALHYRRTTVYLILWVNMEEWHLNFHAIVAGSRVSYNLFTWCHSSILIQY